MTQEEKKLLLKDLCARSFYGVMCDRLGQTKKLLSVSPNKDYCIELDNGEYTPNKYKVEDVKPYLRPMSSMTEEEREACADFVYRQSDEPCWIDEYGSLNLYGGNDFIDGYTFSCYLDWLTEHHFDYRGLIEEGLALEAPEDMYK